MLTLRDITLLDISRFTDTNVGDWGSKDRGDRRQGGKQERRAKHDGRARMNYWNLSGRGCGNADRYETERGIESCFYVLFVGLSPGRMSRQRDLPTKAPILSSVLYHADHFVECAHGFATLQRGRSK
jgi:hypothetical protein